MSNPYWENICSLAEKQRSKGIATYGQGLEANPADVVARINHLQEELIDALMYCEWIKDTTSKWTPVTERLPKPGVEVLVCNEYGDYWLSFMNEGYGEPPYWFNTDGGDPTHWMPLPELPKGDV
jgi:hypothetical protein